ncbi:MAG: AtpZ/AtpI family protein [Nitrospirota bacterium]|nr:AtpZ/AtpI family protein [Nitrospirota bacterium]
MQGGLSLAVRIGTELVVATFMGAGLGYWGDRRFGTTPWLLLLGFVLGTAAGIRNVMRLAARIETGAGAGGKTGAGGETGKDSGGDDDRG